MTYQHSMHILVNLKPRVDVDMALAALKPLSDFFGWERDDILQDQLPEDDTVEFTVDAGFVRNIAIRTGGDVTHDFPECVDALAAQLAPIAEPGYIELRDHDTGDLERAIALIWYGEPSRLAAAQRAHAWEECFDLLRSVHIPDEVMRAVVAAAGIHAGPTPGSDGVASAFCRTRQLFGELLESVAALTEVVDGNDARTVVDLLKAVLGASHTGGNCGQPGMLEDGEALPSGATGTAHPAANDEETAGGKGGARGAPPSEAVR